MKTNQNWSQQLLHRKKLKATTTRIQVLDLIKAYNSAMPVSALQNQLDNFDRVTLYRILNTFLKKGVIHKAHINKDDVYYALCGESCSSENHIHQHVHFKCKSCETVSCVHLDQEVTIQLPNLQIENINIEATGYCNNCKAA